jgi:hypothetical protein
VIESHTTTCEWQDFEARMRWRRADHVLRQACAALDTGSRREALQLLDEARALCPTHPLLPELLARLRAPANSSHAPAGTPASLWGAIALAWLLAATVLIA